MSATLGTITQAVNQTGQNPSVSFAHTAGKEILVFIGARLTNSATVPSSVTYDGVAMTQIVLSNAAGVGSPYIRAAAYRMADPGAKTADIVVSWSNSNVSFTSIFVMDVTGSPDGASMVDSSGSTAGIGTDTPTVTHSRVSADTLSVYFAVRGRSTTATTFTANSPLNEVLDVDGANNSISQTIATNQETSSGSLARSCTASSSGNAAAVCVSLTTDTTNPPIQLSIPTKALTQTRYAPTLAHNANSPKLTSVQAGQSPTLKKNYSIPILAITATKYAPSITRTSPIAVLTVTQNCRDVTVKNHYAVPIIVLIEALHNPLFLLTLPVNELVQSLHTPKIVKTFNIPTLVCQHTNTTLQLKKNIQVSVRNTIQVTPAPALGKTCPVLPIVSSAEQIQPTLNVKAEKLTTQLQLLLPRLGGGLTLQFSVTLPHPTIFFGGVQIDTLQVSQLLPECRFAHEPIEIPRLSLRQTTYTPEYRLLDYKGSTSWRIKQKRKARRRRHYERQSMMIAFRMDPKAVTVKQLLNVPAGSIIQSNLQPQTIRENAGLSIVQYNHAPNTILNTPIEVFSVFQSTETPSVSSFSSNIPVLSIIETLSAPTIGANNRNIDKLVFTQRGLMPAVAAPIIRVIQSNINPFIVNKYNTPAVTYTQTNAQPSLVSKNNSPKLSFVQSNKTITVTLKYNSDARQILQTLYPPDTLFRIRLNVPIYLSTQVLKSPTLTKLYGIPSIVYSQTNSAPRLVRRYPIPPLYFTFVGLQPSIQTIPPEYAVKSIAEDRVIYYFAEDRVIIGYLGDRTIASLKEIRNVERV